MSDDTVLLQVLAKLDQIQQDVAVLRESPVLVDLETAAKLLSLSSKTIKRGLAAGKYATYRHGRAVRVNVAEIRLAMRQEGPHAEN